MSKRTHPTPWSMTRTSLGRPAISDATHHHVVLELETWRIVRAVNAYESPVARAERIFLKTAELAARCFAYEDHISTRDAIDLAANYKRLLAARAKAKKVKTK